MNPYKISFVTTLLLATKIVAQEQPKPHVKLYIPYEQYSQQDNQRIIN